MESIDYRAFRVSVLQATIYTPDLDHSTSKVMSGFYPKCADIFDADPQVLPNMTGFPPEVPRIILGNKNDLLKFEIAASRINFFGRFKAVDAPTIDIKQFYRDAVRLFSLFQEITDCRIGRLAAVRTLFVIHDNPGLFLARHFCKNTWDQTPLNRPKNFELHSHKVYKLADSFIVNSWARNKTGLLTAGNKKTRIILFEQDLNTLLEEIEKKVYATKDIEVYYNEIIPEFDNVLCQYYPINDGGQE